MRWTALVLALGACRAVSEAITTGKAADFYVKELPGVDPTVPLPEMHSGLIEVGTELGLGEASLFFWHVRASNDTKKTIVWFNGGPGCSSMDGNLLELGPLRFDPHTKQLTESRNSWSKTANLLFIDQPFGTGYSEPNSGAFAETLDIAADVVVQFLSEYANIFPEIAATDVYLAGESYAGQYVPYIWKALSKRPDVEAKLGGGVSGIILGNPWIDPANQYLSYVPFVKEKGLVSNTLYTDLDKMQSRCIDALQEKVTISSKVCELINEFVLKMSNKEQGKCINVYKYTERSPYPHCGMEWPSEVPVMTEWLSRKEVREALHGPLDDSKGWSECSSLVYSHLNTDSATPAVALLPEILERIPVMLMIGDLDYICNARGLNRMVENLVWNSDSPGFASDESPTQFSFGTIQSARNLTVAHVAEGSHMLPVDDLLISKKLMMHFTDIERLHSDAAALEPGSDPKPEAPGPSQDEIDDAVSRAYKKAGIIALIAVLIVLAALICVWWRRGEGLSGKGLVQALLQTSTRFKTAKKDQYFPLQNLGRRPDVIIEEDEEDIV